jgi:hypothetical protein
MPMRKSENLNRKQNALPKTAFNTAMARKLLNSEKNAVDRFIQKSDDRKISCKVNLDLGYMPIFKTCENFVNVSWFRSDYGDIPIRQLNQGFLRCLLRSTSMPYKDITAVLEECTKQLKSKPSADISQALKATKEFNRKQNQPASAVSLDALVKAFS